MDGFFNLYKESGDTSHFYVKQIRKLFPGKKVGYLGTLDPLACGVLPIAIGSATKFIPFVTNHDKKYRARIHLGVETDTYDKEGKIISEKNPDVSISNIETYFQKLNGEIDQIIPNYSSKKVDGKKLYTLARQGTPLQIKLKKTVTIYSARILKVEIPFIEVEIACSSGTFIRSIAHELGQELGCGACLDYLLRTKAGDFKIEDSIRLSEFITNPSNYQLKKPEVVLGEYKKCAVSSDVQTKILHGAQPIIIFSSNISSPVHVGEKICAISKNDSTFIAMLECIGGVESKYYLFRIIRILR